jgi:hypothetical protein
MFHPAGEDDTKLRRDETVFLTGEDTRKPALDTNRPRMKGRKGPRQGIVMIKALSAVALGAFVAAGITVLLCFAPKVEASVTAPLGKSDRLEIQDCSDDRIWPNPCLREVGYEILKYQLVTAERASGREGRGYPAQFSQSRRR